MADDVTEIIEKIKHTHNYFEKSRLIRYLQTEKKLTTKAVSAALDMKPSYLCHITRLNRLPEFVVDGYFAQMISISHLFIIARLKEKEQMNVVYEQALSKNLTVLQTEELVREYLYQVKTEGEHFSNQDVGLYKVQVENKFKNVSVKIIQTRVRGKIILEVKGNLKKTSQILKNLLESLSR